MESKINIEKELRSALAELAKSINSGNTAYSNESSFIEITSKMKLSNMNYWERFIREEYAESLRSTVPSKLKFWIKESSFLTWVDLISWDGYKREKTLRAISSKVPNKFLLALIVRRLNDWVPQVRLAARDKLIEIVENSSPEDVIEVLFFTLSHWSSWRRMESRDRATLLKAIAKPEFSQTVKSKIISSSDGPMPLILSQVSRSPVLDSSYQEISLKAIQPFVRASAYRALLDNTVKWVEGKKWVWKDLASCDGRMQAIISKRELTSEASFKDCLLEASKDQSAIVRKVAAEYLIKELEQLGSDANDLADKFSKDESKSVAERGSFALRKIQK